MGIEKDPCLERIGCADPEILDYVEHLAAEVPVCPEPLQDIEGLLAPPLLRAFQKEVEVGGAEHEGDNRLLFPDDLFCVPRHLQAMGDPLKVRYEQALHLQGHAVLEEIDALGRKLRPQLPQAIGRILAVCGAPEIHPWIDDRLPAAPAFSVASSLKNSTLLPQWGQPISKMSPGFQYLVSCPGHFMAFPR